MRFIGLLLAILACAACDSTPTSPTDASAGSPCFADVEVVDWRHYRSFPGSPAIYFAVRHRVTGATPGCVADTDIRFKVTQGNRVLTERWGGTWMYAGEGTYEGWLGNSSTGSYLVTLPDADRPYRIAWTWAWCWRVPPLATYQGCEADEP